MQFPSFTFIISGFFLSYILYSIYTVSLLFHPPMCTSPKFCLKSYLNNHPKMQLNLYTSIMSRPLKKEVKKVYTNRNFDYSIEKTFSLTIEIPHKTQQNGTLFLHVLLSPFLSKPDEFFSSFKPDLHMVYALIKMTEYAIPKAKAYNLLGENESIDYKELDKTTTFQTFSHLKSKITFNIMTDSIELPFNNVPLELSRNLRITNDNKFLPILNYNFLYTRYKDLIKINPNLNKANITITYNPISIGKLRLILHIEAAMQHFKDLGFTNKDIDEVKGIFADTNLYLLAGTVFISAMHLLFDFLAFKNDISFWRCKNNLAGLSMQTVMWRAFSQAVIFLYLLDEGSSLIILIPTGIGTFIEFWKTKKILRAEIFLNHKFIPKIKLNWRNFSSAENKTKELDGESMKYLSYILYPIIIFGAIYSLMYIPHKSWHSWCIQSTVNGVYAFGFLFMLPQLFVNYKLKSVAHLPWRSFMYKAFNTFIDDVFAFVISMPTAHRVACFRDDAVFLIYLYQRWLYPVDKNRVDDGAEKNLEGALKIDSLKKIK